MDKATFIEKRGAAEYERKKEMRRMSYHIKAHGIKAYRMKLREQKSYYKTIVAIPAPAPDDDIEDAKARKVNRREKAEMLTEVFQKQIRKEWSKTHKQQSIIIITLGAISTTESLAKYKCEIHQLDMEDEDIKEFKGVCERVIFGNTE